MRVLLINPFYPLSETPSPPLGLAYLAGALEQAGHAVHILDCVVYPLTQDRLEALLRDFKPDLAGATAVSMTVDQALAVLDQVKAIDRTIVSVLGGPHATFCADDILRTCPQVDAVACGEGEVSVVALVAAIESSRGWDRVPGIVFRGNDHHVATALPPHAELDALPPPARHLLPLGRYRALGMPVSMTTSRGCPYPCIFCVGRKMVGARVRYHHPVRVVDEMQQLSTMGFHQINLVDDLFTANPNHCLAVCAEILNRGLQVDWTSFARVDTVSRQVLEAMYRAGCTTISFGVESGCPQMLDRIKKGITLDQVVRAVRLCIDIGIDPHASFILGLPGETQASLNQTVEFGQRLKTMGVSHGFHILAPFPGTDIRDHIADYDLQILSNDWQSYHANRAIVRTAAVSPQRMDAIVIDSERQFDEWLAKIDRLRDQGMATAETVWPLVRLEHTVVFYDMMMKALIETQGAWSVDPTKKPDPAPLETLMERLVGKLDHPPERIRAALTYAVANHHLVIDDGIERVRWSWTDYLD